MRKKKNLTVSLGIDTSKWKEVNEEKADIIVNIQKEHLSINIGVYHSPSIGKKKFDRIHHTLEH